VGAEYLEATYLKLLLEGSAFLKGGAGFGKPVGVPGDAALVVPFGSQLALYSEVLVEGELYLEGELLVV